MDFSRWFYVLVVFLPLLQAAQTSSGKPLPETIREGNRLFVHECSICHVGTAPDFETWGPPVDKELVAALGENEARKVIMSGTSGGMPGFRYELKPADIDKIVSYLKTVAKNPKFNRIKRDPTQTAATKRDDD